MSVGHATVAILAAGLSTRYGRLKQLEPLGPAGETLLDYAAFDAWRAGFARILLIVRAELEERFRAHIRGRWPEGLQVAFHHQRLEDLGEASGGRPGKRGAERLLASRRKPWGTAHALLTARERLPGPFVVLNADDFYGASAFTQAVSLLEGPLGGGRGDPAVFGLVAYTLADTLSPHGGVSRGLCRVGTGGWMEAVQEVLGVQLRGGEVVGRTVAGEPLTLTGREPVSTNFWVFTPELFPALEEGWGSYLEEVAGWGVDRSGACAPGVEGPAASGPPAESEFLIPTEVNRLLATGQARVRVRRASDPFFGITHPGDREWVVEGLARLGREGRYPDPLFERRDSTTGQGG